MFGGLQSLFCCQYHLEVLSPSQAPWEIPGEAPGLRVSKKLTHLQALGKESSVSPGRPWLGILLVTQLCGMGSAAPVSRDSLQQNPGDDRLRGSC